MDGTRETIRLIGIDTPETVDPRKPVQCFGGEASNKAKELLSGKKVRIEKDSTQGDRDKYGRLLTYIYREDGLFFNKYMIEQGYAYEYTYDTPYKYQAEFKEAEKYARESAWTVVPKYLQRRHYFWGDIFWRGCYNNPNNRKILYIFICHV